jgi:DNA adenine methylase
MNYTPLRYPGGKGQLAPFVKLLFQYNNLLDGHYVEPYAGGAGVALSLLFQECASHIHINDLNRSVYAFWYSALRDTTALCELIRETAVNMDEWRRQKAVQARQQDASLLELGFSTFFLNRTNRSGILTGGVIGGKEQQGEWKIDARYNKAELIQRIRKVAQYRNRISIYNQDASVFIKEALPRIPEKSLVYFDPPYYAKGQDLYSNYYKHDDHAAIAKLVATVSQRWIVSYDNLPPLTKFYSDYRSIAYDYHYSAANRYDGSEIIFFDNRLIIPPVENPGRISLHARRISAEPWRQSSFS